MPSIVGEYSGIHDRPQPSNGSGAPTGTNGGVLTSNNFSHASPNETKGDGGLTILYTCNDTASAGCKRIASHLLAAAAGPVPVPVTTDSPELSDPQASIVFPGGLADLISETDGTRNMNFSMFLDEGNETGPMPLAVRASELNLPMYPYISA
eukprot:scaffold123543_cov33-Prasinocladus_malaysianus.AAC.3